MYLLSKLDGTIIDGVFPREWLKCFFPRRGVAVDAEVEEGTEEDEVGDGVAEEDVEEGERDIELDDGGIVEEDDEEVAGDNGKVDEIEE